MNIAVNQINITCHVFASQLSGHCDAIANQLWRHQQNVKRATETRGWCVKILVLAQFMDSLCHVRNKIMYVLLWRTVYVLTRVLFWCLFSPRCCTTREINTKITLSWAHKQFPTWVHTLFSMGSNEYEPLQTYPNILKQTFPFLYILGLNRTRPSPVVISFTRGGRIG